MAAATVDVVDVDAGSRPMERVVVDVDSRLVEGKAVAAAVASTFPFETQRPLPRSGFFVSENLDCDSFFSLL